MKDYLKLHLQELPYFRALLRAVEARFYQDISLPEPVLDLGCGDGHFASLAFEQDLQVGLDPWWGPIKEAASRDVYRNLVCGAGSRMPFPSNHFSSAVSNSVLEHIPDLDPVIKETARVLKPGAPFIFCVPNHRFLDSLSIGRWLDRMRLSGLANTYRSFFNKISRHFHCDSRDTWKERLNTFGFHLEESWDYFPPPALKTLEWGHYFGLPSLVSKTLFNKWIIFKADWNLYIPDILVRRHYDREPQTENGVYSFYISRRIG